MQKQKLEKRLTYIEPGGGTPLYKPYRYVPNQTVRFLHRFCLKTGIDFAGPFWSGIRVRYHFLWGGTYLCGLYKGLPPSPPPRDNRALTGRRKRLKSLRLCSHRISFLYRHEKIGRLGVASFCYRNRAEITLVICEQKPPPVQVPCKSFPIYC